MTLNQRRTALAASVARGALMAHIPLTGDPTDSERTAWEAKAIDLRAAVGTAETASQRALGDDAGETTETNPELDAQSRERISLRSQSDGLLVAILEKRAPSGAAGEYLAACEALNPNQVPIDLFERDRPRMRVADDRGEQFRAATPAPATGLGANTAAVMPFVFAPSIAPRLGIEMPTVPSGAYSAMTISTSVPAAPKAAGVDADDTAGALTSTTANPVSIRARMTVRIEDVAKIGVANFEAALRQNVSMKLSDVYDAQCIAGDGAAPNVNGLINQLTDPANPTALANFAAFLKEAAGAIDGLWAGDLRQIAIVTNADAYRLSAQVFRAASADLSFSDYARQALGAWWCNKRMPATPTSGADSKIAKGIAYRMGQPGVRTAIHPTWGTISIDDIFTDSRSGQRHFTVHMLVGDKVLLTQPDAYALTEYQVVA